MSKFFKKARTEEVTRYDAPGGEDWMDFRAEFTKDQSNAILSEAPSGERDLRGGFHFFEVFFRYAIKGWSFTDEEDSPVAPTVENYLQLEAGAARWVDEKIAEHVQKTLGAKVEELEGKSSDSAMSPASEVESTTRTRTSKIK